MKSRFLRVVYRAFRDLGSPVLLCGFRSENGLLPNFDHEKLRIVEFE